ncbi:carboxylesterase type b [Diplodia corticola]|uniref:Carboxylic ester hydrolase n=1 Tax=Diplodia corticola TaxID=236234 RepID=A0A1J9RR57_9PEZI|nr:carboxylesterase type b [Diplodia corticola]OJD30021.1 carboxylesterase type b [Diplodia corticola]
MFKDFSIVLTALLTFVNATPVLKNPYDAVSQQWPPEKDGLKVDLGYGIYQGYHNSTSQLNIWKGVRYAAPPLHSLRFQAPEVPAVNRQLQNATTTPLICPQANPTVARPELGALFFLDGPSSEDCLFLNVYAPDDAHDLPVFVWIHGGGYDLGGTVPYDPSALINTNNQDFVAVVIQYRLGAFGFLSSEEVRQKGALNAGLLDQQMTLQWVQEYIDLFGGDPTRVTVAGESAGAGSVMNLAIAYGGAQGNQLWSNGITASPFLPQYFDYNSPEAVSQYNEFADLAGCTGTDPAVFECLQSASSADLIFANNQTATSALLGIFEWRPVVDGDLIPQRPSQALKGRINGQRILTGNNANEGYALTPQNITTQAELVQYLRTYFPRLTDSDVTRILEAYSTPNVPDSPATPKFPTTGDHPPTAVNQSELATGHQQVANNFYGEVTLICLSYWLASAFDRNGGDSFQYQLSVTPSFHGFDTLFYFPNPSFPVGAEVQKAFQSAWGGFITANTPSDWPRHTAEQPLMENVNATGGTPVEILGFTFYFDPGVEADLTTVRADTWEGGRGERCELLRELSEALVI